DAVKEMEKRVKDNQNRYEVQSDQKRVFQKAQIAMRLGLGDKALQVLLESEDLEFGKEGTQMELDLLLSMGRLEELREQLWPKDEKQREVIPEGLNQALGIGTYERYRFLLAAAEGDYQEADEFLEKARVKTLTDPGQLREFRVRLGLEQEAPGSAKEFNIPQLMSVGVAKAILEGAPAQGPLGYQATRRMLRDLPLGELMR